jgi:hypothetical protein
MNILREWGEQYSLLLSKKKHVSCGRILGATSTTELSAGRQVLRTKIFVVTTGEAFGA